MKIMSTDLSELRYTLDKQFDELPKDVIFCISPFLHICKISLAYSLTPTI